MIIRARVYAGASYGIGSDREPTGAGVDIQLTVQQMGFQNSQPQVGTHPNKSSKTQDRMTIILIQRVWFYIDLCHGVQQRVAPPVLSSRDSRWIRLRMALALCYDRLWAQRLRQDTSLGLHGVRRGVDRAVQCQCFGFRFEIRRMDEIIRRS